MDELSCLNCFYTASLPLFFPKYYVNTAQLIFLVYYIVIFSNLFSSIESMTLLILYKNKSRVPFHVYFSLFPCINPYSHKWIYSLPLKLFCFILWHTTAQTLIILCWGSLSSPKLFVTSTAKAVLKWLKSLPERCAFQVPICSGRCLYTPSNISSLHEVELAPIEPVGSATAPPTLITTSNISASIAWFDWKIHSFYTLLVFATF